MFSFTPFLSGLKRRSTATPKILFYSLLLSVLQAVAISVGPSASATSAVPGSACFNNNSVTSFTNASYIDLNHVDNAVGTNSFTLEMWLKFSSPGTMTLVNGHSAANGNTSGLNLFFDGSTGQTSSYIGQMSVINTVRTTMDNVIPDQTWVHYAYVRNGSTAKIFVNGVPKAGNGTTSVSSYTDSTNYSSSVFRIGFHSALRADWPLGFTGCMAGVALTKSALYSSDFSANLPYPKTRTMPANSVIFLIPTASGFSNTGTGAQPSITGSVEYRADVPEPPAIAISGATVSGTKTFGQVLTASAGTVTNASSYTTSYQWRRNGTAISGATNSTYTLTSADIGSAISVQITVSDGSTSASASSSPTPNIAKATPTFSAWENVPKNYGDSSFTVTAPTVTGSLDGTFSYSSANPSVISVSGSTFTVVGAGTSVITATFTPNDSTGYNTATTNMTVTVAKASLGVTASSHTVAFGAAVPTITPTYSGFVNGDTSSVISGTTCSTSYITTTPVGTIASSCTGATSSNYSFTYTPGVITVTKAVQSAVTLSSLSAAYNSSNKSVSLTGFGGSGTGSYTYALDASNTTAGCAVNTSTLTYTTAGTCVVAVTRTLDTNYFARTDVVSFSIGLASQTITFGSLSAKSYSSDTFTVSASSSAALTVVFTSASPTICTTSGTSGSTITLLGVGTCVINANQAGDANTSAASQVSQNFTVNPRAITVTADAKSKSYGASDPTLTYTITTGSLVLGDALTGALSRAAGSDAGTYQIQQGALTTANNPKYAITFVAADLTINRVTPTLVLTYPNSNVAILRPGATDTPTVTTSSSSGSLTFATTAASSICTVDSTTGVISLFGAGSCPVAMTTAQTTNYIQYTETTTVTIALLSTSLTGISQSNLVSMGNPFYAHASIDQSYSFSSGSNGASVAIPAGALDASVPISIHLLADSTDQRALVSSDGTSVLSVVVSWVAADGSVPNTNTGKAISVTLTNPSIKSGAKIYSIIGNQSTLLGTAKADGSITTLITEDPVLLVINPVVTTPAPSSSSSSGGGGGGGYVMAVAVDNSAAIEAANLKLAADKAAAELKAAQEKRAAEEAEAAAIKAAKELADAQAQAAAELKAAQDKAAEELRIAEELRLAQLKAEEDLKAAAAKKAAADSAAAARAMKPAVTLYSVSSTLKLSAYDSAYLAKYVRSLKNGAAVTCIGYTYGKSPASQASQTLAKRQANAVCTQMKKTNKTLRTSIVIYPASKAPKAAVGAKWVGVSYRIDGIKNP